VTMASSLLRSVAIPAASRPVSIDAKEDAAALATRRQPAAT